MEEKKIEIKEDLDQIVGGTNTSGQSSVDNENPFANMPRVDDNPYTPDVTNRA